MASSTPSHALFGLRDDTPQYEFEGPEHCSQILSRHYDLFDLSPVEQSQCIIISKVDRQAIDHYFGENGYGILALAGYNYLIKQQLLLIKTITRAHKNASFFFHQLLMDRLSEMGISRRNLYSFGAAGTTTDTRLKRPDDSYSPKGPPSRKWPTVVLEAGYVQSQGKLDQDARWWLQEFQGDVKIVLTISFWPDRRISTIQKWNLVDRPTANVPQRQVPEVVYGIDISQSAAKQPVQASHTEPLILPFADIFLRQPSEKDNQRDVLMSVEDLQELAEDVWEVQFDFPYDNDDGDDDDDAD